MADLSDKGSESEGTMSKSPSPDRASSSSEGNGGQLKTCADCGTTKTPLWRGGPAGPKSLCNACGIRSRKKRRALLGLNKDDKKPKKTSTITSGGAAAAAIPTAPATAPTTTIAGPNQSNGTRNDRNELGDSLKRRLMALGREVVMQRPRSTLNKQRRKLGEEEQAAILLMAMSCGSVYA